MKLSTRLLVGLFLASAADATWRTNLYLGRKPQNGMKYPVFGLTGIVGSGFDSSLATTQTDVTQTVSSSNPLDMTFGPNSLITKALKRIKEQDGKLKIENGDQQQEIQGETPHNASSKSKPSLYSLPDIKYVLLDQQGKEFKLNVNSRNLVTGLFAEMERYKAENDVKNARALLEEIFRLLDEKGLTLHVGINGTPMRTVTKDNMITALGAPPSFIDILKSMIDYEPERKPTHKAALTGMDFVEISSPNAYVTNPESAALAIEPAQNDVSLVLFNNQGKEVKIVTESVNQSVSELEHLIQTNKFFKWLEENQLTLYASLNGGHLVPVNGDEFISFFETPRSNLLMIENSENDAEAETETEEYDVILEAIRGLFIGKEKESDEYPTVTSIKPDTPVASAGNPKILNPVENQNVKNGTSAAASTIVTDDPTDNLLADPTKSKFPWKALMFSAGGLALVAAIVSAVYIASQTNHDEESVEL